MEHIRYDGLIHGFFTNPWGLPQREDAIQKVGRYLKSAFGNPAGKYIDVDEAQSCDS